jgi:hypothetical protein
MPRFAHPTARVWRALLVAAGSMLLSACGGAGDEPPAAPAAFVPAQSHAAGDGADVCNAPPSTVLFAVPPAGSTATPVNARIHYNRPDGNYADWGLHLWQVNESGQYVADYPGVSWPAPLPRAGFDSYGAFFEIEASKFTHPSAAGFGFIVHPPGQAGDPGIDRFWKFSDGTEFWLRSGDAAVYRSNPLAGALDLTTVRVHYKRYDNAYSQWGLHLWPSSGIDVARLPGLTIDQWTNPVPLSAMPNYSAAADGSEIAFDLPVLNPLGDASRTGVEFIIHGLPGNPNGGVDNKDGWSSNIRVTYAALSVSAQTGHVWLVQEEPTVFTSVPDTRVASTTDARAVWLTRSLVKWPKTDTAGSFRLYHSATGQIVARRGAAVTGADGALDLQVASSVPPEAAERFRYVGAGVLLAVAHADDTTPAWK